MCKQPVLAFYCSRPLIYEGPHIGFQFYEGNSEFNSEERNSDSNSNSNDGNSNSIPIPPGLGKANSNSIPIPELDLELARKSNSGAELTPTLPEHLLYASPEIHTLLAICFNAFIVHGFLPSYLTDSVIIPIIVKNKCKNISDAGNYRPIALSSVLSKV